MAKKSETLAQRQKAQRDLIELKKMQAGELSPGPKPSEEAVLPKTAKEKIANFFYHNKIALAIGGFVTVVAIIMTVNLINRIDYDSKVVVFSYDVGYSLFNQRVAEYFETLYTDVNGNGKVDVAAIDCSVNPEEYGELKTTKLTQLNAMLSVESDAIIYLLDEESIHHFTDNLETEIFKEENMVPLGEDFYDFIEVEGSGVPETKLFAAVREVAGTTIDGKNNSAYEAALDVLDLIREKAGEK